MMTIEFNDNTQKVEVKCNEPMAEELKRAFPSKFFEKFAQQWQKTELEETINP